MLLENPIDERDSISPGQAQYVGGRQREPAMIGVIEGVVGDIVGPGCN